MGVRTDHGRRSGGAGADDGHCQLHTVGPSLNIVLCCWGSYGDLFPTLGLAEHLKARGHDPIVATCPYYRDLVTQAGIEFRPVRPDVDPADTAMIARIMDPSRGPQVVIRDILVAALRESYADTCAAIEGADLVVSHPVTFAASIAAERQGVPWISTALAPVTFFSVHDFPLLPPNPAVTRLARLAPWAARGFLGLARAVTGGWTRPVRALRAECGLPDRGDPLYEGQFSPRGTIALYSRVLGAPQQDWPPHTTQTGFVFRANRGTLPPEVAAFLDAGAPPIVFTLGSSAVGTPGMFYEESLAAAQLLGTRAIFLVGKETGALKTPALSSVPADMLRVDYVSHELIFPRAAAVVHHGGVGTTGQALRAGVPMLVVPHAHDQPDNAFRVASLGVASVVDARKYTAARAASHLRELQDRPDVARRAREVAAIIASEPGAAGACEVIERAPRWPDGPMAR